MVTFLNSMLDFKNVNFASPHLSFGTVEKLGTLLLILPISAIFIDYFLSHSVIGYGYRIFVSPGVIIHEVAHALGCLITGAKITAFNIFEKEGGRVEHHKPKVFFIGQIIISLAPFFAGIVAIYFLSKMVGFREVNLIGVPLTVDGIKNAVLKLVSSIDKYDKKNWLLLYLLISIVVTMVPSKQDIKNILISLILLASAVFIVFHYTTYRFDLISNIPPQLIMVVGTIDLLLILILAFSIIIFVLSKLIKK